MATKKDIEVGNKIKEIDKTYQEYQQKIGELEKKQNDIIEKITEKIKNKPHVGFWEKLKNLFR